MKGYAKKQAKNALMHLDEALKYMDVQSKPGFMGWKNLYAEKLLLYSEDFDSDFSMDVCKMGISKIEEIIDKGYFDSLKEIGDISSVGINEDECKPFRENFCLFYRSFRDFYWFTRRLLYDAYAAYFNSLGVYAEGGDTLYKFGEVVENKDNLDASEQNILLLNDRSSISCDVFNSIEEAFQSLSKGFDLYDRYKIYHAEALNDISNFSDVVENYFSRDDVNNLFDMMRLRDAETNKLMI